jgi:hypothetical protein
MFKSKSKKEDEEIDFVLTISSNSKSNIEEISQSPKVSSKHKDSTNILKLSKRGSNLLKKLNLSPSKKKSTDINSPSVSSPISKSEIEENKIDEVLKQLEKVRQDCKQSLPDVNYVDETNYTFDDGSLSEDENEEDEIQDHPDVLKMMRKK